MREIGKVAWYLAKFLGVGLGVLGLIFLIFQRSPLAAVATSYALVIALMIGFTAWSSYKWKRDAFREQAQRERERTAREREREAREREHAATMNAIRNAPPD